MLKVGEQLYVTDLDFDSIKANIKAFYKNGDSPFKDWDFEGSGLNTILDILAYNTHYNAVLAHTALNESFMDSSQIRSNVVSAAKLIGYTPRSATAAQATVDVTFQAIGTYLADSMTLPKGTPFKTIVDGTTYTFLVMDVHATMRTLQNTFVFTGVQLMQGTPERVRHLVNASNPNQTFTIDATSSDLSALKVNVYPNASSTILEQFIPFRDFSGVDGDSPIYFLNENSLGQFEISFGDNVFGRRPGAMNVVEFEYMKTSAAAANGAQVFTYAGSTRISSNSFGINPIVRATSPAVGGNSRESMDSIKFNAPLAFIAQNRAVTPEDYGALIRSNFGYIDAISVWGGEDEPVPQYGKVFISIKPIDGNPYANVNLTEAQRTEILEFLSLKKSIAITPEIVDPDYMYIFFDVLFKYEPSKTSLTSGALESQVRAAITRFNSDYLDSFGGVFRFSKFLKAIDSANGAINSSLARISVYKRQTLPAVSPPRNIMNFGLPFDGTVSQTSSMLTTIRGWTRGGVPMFIADEPIAGDNVARRLFTYYVNTQVAGSPKVKVDYDIGRMHPSTGMLEFAPIKVDADTTLELAAVPSSDDVIPLRNQLLMFDINRTTITSEVESLTSTHTSSSNFLRNQ